MVVLVTGASGFVGRRLVPALLEAGYKVRVLVRDRTRYDAPANVEVHEGDLLERSSLDGAFDDVEAAYYLVHSLTAGSDFASRDQRAASNFAQAASLAGVERVIYLGGLGETGSDLSEHLQSRQDVEDTLASGEYALTTLRAAIIIGHGSSSFQMIRELAKRLPVMVTPSWVRTPCQPIAINDVVAYLVGVLDVPETAGEVYEIGGPDVLTYEEMMKQTANAVGRSPIILSVPLLSLRLSVYWVDLVTSVPKEIAHPLIYGMKNPVVASDERIRDLVPIELTPFETAVERALERDL